MDKTKSKKDFTNALSYNWLKICAFTLIAAIVWMIVFSVISPRVTNGQTFYFYTFGDIESIDLKSLVKNAQSGGALSYDVREIVASKVAKDEAQRLTAYLGAGEGDVIVVRDDTFNFGLSGFYDIDSLLADTEEYCMKFSSSESEFIIDEQKVREDFLKNKKKDKRFKTQKQKEEGVVLAEERVANMYKSAVYLKKVLTYCDENNVAIRKITKLNEKDETEQEKTYALKLSAIDKAINCFSTRDKDGKLTTEGLYISVFDYRGTQGNAQFETVGFLAYLVRNYGNFPISE